jgi:hypothetical protein
LLRPGVPIKLWEIADTGLGAAWAAHGWVLWRWAGGGGEAESHEGPALAWFEVDPSEGAGTALGLNAALAAAAHRSTLEEA